MPYQGLADYPAVLAPDPGLREAVLMADRSKILGAVLAGGRSTRFGSDKGEALLKGRSLLSHAIASLETECDEIILCAGDRITSESGIVTLSDRPEPGLGPLGGLCAALSYALRHGFDVVLSAPVDAHPIPAGLGNFFSSPGPAVLADHWLFGVWPAALASELEQHLRDGHRSVRSWIEACGARRVEFLGQPPVNLNSPDMLAALQENDALREGAEIHALRVLDFASGQVSEVPRFVPVEIPVAIEFNGIGYAVMMATPTDLEDFVTGFALAEGLAQSGEIGEVLLHRSGGGWVARANLPQESLPRLMERARTRVSESSCGICGIESVAAALAPLAPVAGIPEAKPAAIHRALSELRRHQRLGTATGAAHAAAFCSWDGDILLLREDVGRHNALDKLIGALSRRGMRSDRGFALLSARCSQELVEKTVRAAIPMLVTISAPSSLAIARAREGRLTLLALARDDSALVVTDPHRLF